MEIRSFHEVVLMNEKTLILCDIDDTLLKWDKTVDSCIAEAATLFPTESSYFQVACGQKMWLTYRQSVPPIWTDIDGFHNMIHRMSPTSRIAFLTARTGGVYEHWTKRDFECLGIKYDRSGVFYTGNHMTKGDYIQRFIPLGDFEKVVFIDDLQENIQSVSVAFPKIQCYLWTNT